VFCIGDGLHARHSVAASATATTHAVLSRWRRPSVPRSRRVQSSVRALVPGAGATVCSAESTPTPRARGEFATPEVRES
jgi:hypothetical protein